jgi:hypothetical protein
MQRNRTISGGVSARLLFLTVALSAGSTLSQAADMFVGSPNTLFGRVNANAGQFIPLGACGGIIQSMTNDGPLLFLGTPSSTIYRVGVGAIPEFTQFQAPNDATALVAFENDLFVGGSDGSVWRVPKSGGAPIGNTPVGIAVSELQIHGSHLYAGTTSGVVFRVNTSGGSFEFFGTCGGPINGMAFDDTHMFLSSTLGTNSARIYKINLLTETIDDHFDVASEASAMVLSGGQLFVGGAEGWILRVNRNTGQQFPVLQLDSNSPISAMTLDASEPGSAYCFGVDCPCGNGDGVAGCRNSMGAGAGLVGRGTNSVFADDLQLAAVGLPPGGIGRLYMGAAQANIPFGDGRQCVGSGGYGVVRFPVQGGDSSGTFHFGPGIVSFVGTHGSAPIVPGTTFNFQGWYRNPLGPCGFFFNTTNAYSVTFTP